MRPKTSANPKLSTSSGSPIRGSNACLQFSRYECKYLVSEGKAVDLRDYIEPFVELDPFAARQANRRYEISSLYLDDKTFRLCGETLEGLRNRFKLRIRAYTDRPDDPVFFEVKKRRDRKISKERARVRRSDMLRLFNTGEVSTVNMTPREAGYYESFVSRMRWINAVPKVLVRYDREAFHGMYDETVRVTFDRQLRSRMVDRPSQFFAAGEWNQVESRRVIVEMKFNNKYPPWLTEAIRLFRLERISYSKYVHSLSATERGGTMQTPAT